MTRHWHWLAMVLGRPLAPAGACPHCDAERERARRFDALGGALKRVPHP